MTELRNVPAGKRAGAAVVAPDGAPALVWGYGEAVRRVLDGAPCDHEQPKYAPAWYRRCSCREERVCWLWRDGAVIEVPERQSRALKVLSVAAIYRQGVARAVKRGEEVQESLL